MIYINDSLTLYVNTHFSNFSNGVFTSEFLCLFGDKELNMVSIYSVCTFSFSISVLAACLALPTAHPKYPYNKTGHHDYECTQYTYQCNSRRIYHV